jgi:hypothetical protein
MGTDHLGRRNNFNNEANAVKANIACVNLFGRLQFLSRLVVGFMSLLLPALATGQATFVQVNSNTATVYSNSVAVAFTNPQAAGNLNIIVVGWNDTSATIASVADSNGNAYALAAGTVSTPVPAPGSSQAGVSQAIYYAKNIKAGANTVTVNFNQNTGSQDVRIVEYSGLDLTNPLDTSVGASGSATPASSGAATTNSANDLIFGAGTITTAFTGNGSGFVTRLLNGFGDIVEDQVVTTAGSNTATATLTLGSWVMQMVAFRAAGQTPPTFAAPAIASLSTATSPEAGGIALTITGTNFEPGATVVFSNTAGKTASGVNCAVTLLVSPNATISCLTPSFPAGSASITVTNVDGQASSPFAFTFTASTPFATATSPSVAPNTGLTNGGTAVTIFGSDFAAGAKVTVGGVPADKVSVENVNTMLANFPAGSAGLASVIVTNPSGNAGTLSGAYTYAAGAGINFVQANSAQPASPATTATITYLIAQTAGNLNVVIIGWADTTATVQSVTDSAGNAYNLAFNPNLGTGLSQATYYAKNIHAAASNSVTVTFSPAAKLPDVRVLEYSGLDTGNPLDTGGGAAGTGTALDSGPITTHNAGDLIIGASTVGGLVTAAGPGFITVAITPTGDNVQHLIGPPAGAIDATATQNGNSAWVMQAAAFQLSGTAPDFSVSTVPPTTASVTAGASASYTISVSGLNGFTSPVALTCPLGLPAGAICAFVPPSVTPGTAPVTSTLTITTLATTPAGTSNVTVTGTSGSLIHNTLISLTVTASTTPDFTITSSALTPATVSAGGSATSTITITPLSGFNGAVSLSCGIVPTVTPAPKCAFSSNSVANGSGTSTLTVSTTAATTASLAPQSKGVFYAMWLPIGGLALLGAGLTSRKKKFLCFLFGYLMFSGLIFLMACGGSSSSGGGGGGGNPGTPAGTYTITVTGVSGSLTHPTTVSLKVN